MSRTVQNRTVADPTNQRRCQPMEWMSANEGNPSSNASAVRSSKWNLKPTISLNRPIYQVYINTTSFQIFSFLFFKQNSIVSLKFFLYFKPWKQHRFVHSPNPNSLRINTFFSLRPLSSLVGWLSPLVATLSSLTTTQANNLLEILKRRVLGLKA